MSTERPAARRHRIAAAAAAIVTAGCGAGCSAAPTEPEQPWWTPAPGTTWQLQLSGTVDTSPDVAMYDVDLFDVPADVVRDLHDDGRTIVCYFSAGTFEDWRPDIAAFPDGVIGAPLVDWPGEWWLDIRADALVPVMRARLDLAVARGCDGVDPDNMNGYANAAGFPLTATDQLRYNTWLADEAHARRLSVGLKNDLDQIPHLVDRFDWALNEECFAYGECDELAPFIAAGKAVFGVEYVGDPDVFCPEARARDFSWLYKDLELGSESVTCW